MPIKILLLFCLVLTLQAEHPSCYVNRIAVQGTNAGVVSLQLRDQDNLTANYTGYIIADDPTHNIAGTNVYSSVSTGGTLTLPAFTVGGVNLQDGTRHTLYFAMASNLSGTLTNCSGDVWPMKWNIAASVWDYTYPLYTSVATGINAAKLAVIANSNDPYSVGVSGATVCTVNSIAIKNDGVVGYYVQKNSVPCSNVHVMTTAVAGSVTATQWATDVATLTPALTATEQAIAIGWFQPYKITGISSAGTAGTLSTGTSIPGYFLMSSIQTEKTITSSNTVWQGDFVNANPYFQSNSVQPFTDYGFRPSMMLGWAKCNNGTDGKSCADSTTVGAAGAWTADFATAQAGINASFAARNTSPVNGNVIVTNNSGNFGTNQSYSLATSLATGNQTAIAPASINVTMATPVFSTTATGSSLLLYEFAAATTTTTSALTYLSGAGYAQTGASNGGQLNDGLQTPAQWFLLYGAAAACGSGEEPIGMIATKYPETMLLTSGYTRGLKIVEAIYRSTKQPYNLVCAGDPLAAPWSVPPPSAGTKISGIFSAVIGL